MTTIEINPDQTVSVKWTGERGHGSLYQIMASGNVKLVNQLNINQLIAVLVCVKNAPFPMGNGGEIYRRALEIVENDKEMQAAGEKTGLGELRKYLVQRAGDGCNAPTDSYLQIAVENLPADAAN